MCETEVRQSWDASGCRELPISRVAVVAAREWPTGPAVPSDLRHSLFDSARAEVGVLVHSGLFLSEDTGIHRIFRTKAQQGVRVQGVRVRIRLGDPSSEHVGQRGDDEGVGDAMAAKIKNALVGRLEMDRSMRQWIEHYVDGSAPPHLP